MNIVGVGGTTCWVHGGNSREQAIEKENLRNYRLGKFQAQLNRFAVNPNIKNLRDEIAILRMMLEEKINLCKDTFDITMQSHVISDLVMKIASVVKDCHKLEGAMGQLLDKQALIEFAGEVVGIISQHVNDKATVDKIANSILDVLKREE